MKNLYPDLYVKKINDITASMLIKMGMEAVVLDVDNTLVPHNCPEPTKDVESFLEDMRRNAVKVCVVSNNGYDRVSRFCKKIGIEYFIHSALKPKKDGYRRAAELLGVNTDKILSVGDQLFTDIWGGNRAGCFTVLVDPIDVKSEMVFIKLKRIIERPIINKIKGGVKK